MIIGVPVSTVYFKVFQLSPQKNHCETPPFWAGELIFIPSSWPPPDALILHPVVS